MKACAEPAFRNNSRQQHEAPLPANAGLTCRFTPQRSFASVGAAPALDQKMRLSGAHPKRFQSVEDRCALVLDGLLRVELERGETLEQRRDSDLCLGAGERRSQAKMRATTKGEMRGVRTLDVEAMRIGMQRRVIPSSEQRTGHRLTRLHLPATDLQGLQRKASDLHHRRVVAQHLLDRMG